MKLLRHNYVKALLITWVLILLNAYNVKQAHPYAFIIRAYAIAESIYHMEDLWKQIEDLDYQSQHNQFNKQ